MKVWRFPDSDEGIYTIRKQLVLAYIATIEVGNELELLQIGFFICSIYQKALELTVNLKSGLIEPGLDATTDEVYRIWDDSNLVQMQEDHFRTFRHASLWDFDVSWSRNFSVASNL